MDPKNPVISLCIEGTRAEFAGDIEKARELYQKAWDSAGNDFESCVAAHYQAHLEVDPERQLFWNELALEKANSCRIEEVKDFYPSLYLNLGLSYELLGKQRKAKKYYDKAAELGATHHQNIP